MRARASHSPSRSGPCGQAVLRLTSWTHQSRGPWLARGLCCPSGSSLTMASSETLTSSPLAYFLRPGGSLPFDLVQAWRPELPHFPPRVGLFVPPPVPRWTTRLHSAVASPRALAFVLSARTRHPYAHTRRFSRGLCNEAAKFASCYGPKTCLPFSDKDVYSRAFASGVAPKRRRV
jgi:hypothetical protein